ncbi:2-aminoadipate transaminase [Ensifer psoraleae]|uniref:aminotransferase-like domain-containing protein n=1 Tax=Sinorhizobium psoraleae TaxID=520838 RepID=UPI001568D42A|nr:PLP-dependent aminotransferase family protein [Sinorhizobium psoraleae]NRP70925.1 2-aminoadipate transaminase [Sinorhizobium psoraleae]
MISGHHVREAKEMANGIDLTRTMAPTSVNFSHYLKEALEAISEPTMAKTLLRHHRYLGNELDRKAAAQWTARRLGYAPDLSQIVVSGGTQSALLVILASLVGSGGVLTTEEITYPAVKPICDLLGIQLVGTRIDEEGLTAEGLESVCKSHRPRALYCNPTVHNPTTAIMSNARRREIADIARRYQVTIVEDDVQSLLLADAPRPIAAIAPDITWYLMSLAKTISIGLRVAHVVAPSPDDMRRVLAPISSLSSWFVSPLSAEIATSWLSSGRADVILEEIRKEISNRQKIAKSLLSDTHHRTQPFALHVWIPLALHIDLQQVNDALLARGVRVQTSTMFTLDKARIEPAIRVSLGRPLLTSELEQGLRSVATVVREAR